MGASTPHYPLERIQELVGTRRYMTRGIAVRGAGELGFDEKDIVDCVLALTIDDFYKPMPSEKRAGLWQDVYRPTHLGISLYVKLQIEGERPEDIAVIIQFKRL
jgi:motility quorum-sensing regulator / GCU-specific mRNA interferase toxin